jgi:hypothetical protein
LAAQPWTTNYLIKKLFTALGALQIENQARI